MNEEKEYQIFSQDTRDEKIKQIEADISFLKDSIGSRIFCVWLVLIPVCFLMGFVLAKLL